MFPIEKQNVSSMKTFWKCPFSSRLGLYSSAQNVKFVPFVVEKKVDAVQMFGVWGLIKS